MLIVRIHPLAFHEHLILILNSIKALFRFWIEFAKNNDAVSTGTFVSLNYSFSLSYEIISIYGWG
jgi:hypothetical protein